MDTERLVDENYVQQLLASSQEQLTRASGADRVLAYMTWSLVKEGYYSPDELIELSLSQGFTLDNPYAKIRRGTTIGKGAVVKNNSVIDGTDVRIGSRTVLDGAHISGDDVSVGTDCSVSGALLPSHVAIGQANDIRGLLGDNNGTVVLGHHNRVYSVTVNNSENRAIVIGNHNSLEPGLQINCPLSQGDIRIGNYNSLGRDGGGVISNAYRFTHRWWGHTLIGSHVETTRGAEILGFSLLGWELSQEEELAARRMFVHGPIRELADFFSAVRDNVLPDEPGDAQISLFGVVKVKMSCLTGRVRARDGARIQSSFLRDFLATERSKVYFTTVHHALPAPIKVSVQDRAIEQLDVTGDLNWSQLPTEEQTDGYRREDAAFYAG